MRTKGFTLIEIFIVIAILTTLIALALPAYQQYNEQQNVVNSHLPIKPTNVVVGYNGFFNKDVTTIVTNDMQQYTVVNAAHLAIFDSRKSDYCTISFRTLTDINSPLRDRYNVITFIECE